MIGLALALPTDQTVDTLVVENVPTEKTERNYTLNKDSVNTYPLEEVMAAVAYHECLNLSMTERWLIMEAFHNRVVDNFNNNGITVKDQLLAPKQFTGLWKYRPKDFKYDSSNKILDENLWMAKQIISGIRLCAQRIYYWAGLDFPRHAHNRWVRDNPINLPKYLKHRFK